MRSDKIMRTHDVKKYSTINHTLTKLNKQTNKHQDQLNKTKYLPGKKNYEKKKTIEMKK